MSKAIQRHRKPVDVEHLRGESLRSIESVPAGHLAESTTKTRTPEAEHASQQRYRALFQCVPDAIIIDSPEGHCLDANPSACLMLGYSQQELLGTHSSHCRMEIQAGLADLDDPATTIGLPATRTRQFRRKDGTCFRGESMVTLMPDGNQIRIIRCSTAQVKDEASFRQLADSGAQGVMRWNSDDQITQANDAFLRIIGYSRKDLDAGTLFRTAISPGEFTDSDRSALREVSTTGACTPYHKEFVCKNGSRVSVLITAMSFSHSTGDGACFVLDVTQLNHTDLRLQQTLERFRIASSAAGLGFWDYDVESNTLAWDARMFALYGRFPVDDQLPYSLWTSILHPDDRARCEQEVIDAINGTRPFDTEFRVIHPSGATRYLKAAALVTRAADGRAVQMLGVNFDITSHRLAVEQFRLAIEAAPTGMLLMNSAGSIILVNAQIEILFGYPRSELLGQKIEMLVPLRFRNHHPEFRGGFFSDPRARSMGAGRDLYGLRKDGSEVPVEIGLSPIDTSEGQFVLSSIVDLTQRREMDRLRNDFVSTVSHELRTPLTSISGSLALLQSGAMGELPEKAAGMVRIAYQNSGRLVRLINDILDIGGLESGQLSLELSSVPLTELLRQCVEANASYADEFDVRLRLESGSPDDRVIANPDRLMQVITNLLSNSAKFSPLNAEVFIRVRSGPKTLRVEVQDAGPGIPENFRSRVFEKFAQADASTTRRFEGTGLGLSISRKLIEAMGGTIGFTTVVDHGTTFYIELPRADSIASVANGNTELISRSHKQAQFSNDGHSAVLSGFDTNLRLLYIEDDKDLISVLRATLAGRADIVPAYGLREAERILGDQSFGLVLLDPTLPDGSGFDLIDKIPSLVGRPIPIVILSATDVTPEIRRKVDAVLIKSQVSATQVVATVLSFLTVH
jgi:PAS domain S-box-containing protein